ncbi:MAG: PQQ-binding-like beta-propeller repeat protein [Ferruginibacter sp.]|nr:PQQ-binding-like beta-propeller repeat protein [Cytophagales bacterium]
MTGSLPFTRNKPSFWLFALLATAACQTGENPHRSWRVYRGGPESNCYSAIDQINRGNVAQLRVAWTHRTQDEGVAIQCNPIVVDKTMYVTSPALKVMALEAATGKRKWTFDPFPGGKAKGVNRGVAYWEDGKDRRIFFTAGYQLYALDAGTGQLIPSFGNHGTVDLRQGLDRNPEALDVEVTSPGIVFGNRLIVGSRVSESEGAAPGHVRAYNVHSGKMAWIFHTIPQPGEYGYDTWEKDAWKTIGGANAWSGFSLDEKRGWVFFGTGSCSPDFYGGDRRGTNLFGNSVVALEAASGRRVWHYQIVHHDLWDYDLPTPPNLVTVNRQGRQVDAVAQVTKTGHVFVLDRQTGQPLFPVEERKVPASDVAGEQAWPTQPFPLKPSAFVRQRYAETEMADISPTARAYARQRLQAARNEGMFTPPSRQGSVVFPGMRGGGEWNGASFDPASGVLYVNANEIPNVMGLKKVEAGGADAVAVGKNVYQLQCATCHGTDRRGQPPFPSLVNVHQRLAKSEVRDRVRNGKGQMPAFPQLSDEQVGAVAAYLFDVPKENPASTTRPEPGAGPVALKYANTGYGQFLDQEGYPAVKPPWGTLNAINLNTGELVWKVPLGEYPALTQRGIPPTGTQNFGGTLVTAGGVIFVGASKDEKFRAFDRETGKVLWETTLPAGGYATPSTYEVDGKQYVVIAAGGGGKNATKTGDAYVAFALPD